MSKSINVVIVDDHPIFRQGLSVTIEKNKNLKVIGEADNGETAIELTRDLRPDVLILDVDMPVKDGIETARELKALGLPVKIVFLTMHKDNSILRSLRSLGVIGYVLKDSALNEIGNCIKRVAEGNIYLSPALNDLILENAETPKRTEIAPFLSTLSQAERNVLKLVTESMTSREIAEALFVTVRTVETHRYNICTKLGLNGPNALFKFAIHHKQEINRLA
ncbi:MAG: response regulator transcription factor [Pyrinomonadaceae bacterium]|nr:response regulator transcription factor [Acidobacteriota bacterium]MBK7934831.1 response regulator transcription factor [Acidobacteriota bacterium]MBP7375201.1 response regulator transcription factor [Pyrinomonadaceae bacterium]